jgi:hypothetical protein
MSIIALRQSLACRQIRFIALCPTVLDKLVASISARPPAGKRLLAKNVQLDISP